MLNPNRHVTRVAGLVGTLILAAACSSGGGATTAPTTAPVSTAPSAAPASLPASAAPSAAPSEAAGGSYELTVAKSASLGDYVAGEDGMTLYTFDPDTAPNKSTCNGDCATTWPPFVLETGETSDVVRYDNEQNLGSLLSESEAGRPSTDGMPASPGTMSEGVGQSVY